MALRNIRDLLTNRKDEQEPLVPVAVEQPVSQPRPATSPAVEAHAKLKHKLHKQILEKVDLASLESMPEARLRFHHSERRNSRARFFSC